MSLPDPTAAPLSLAPIPPASQPLALTAPRPQTHGVVLAQQFDQDILGDLGSVFRTFVDSGQVWALIIGIVIGYLFRSMTTYK